MENLIYWPGMLGYPSTVKVITTVAYTGPTTMYIYNVYNGQIVLGTGIGSVPNYTRLFCVSALGYPNVHKYKRSTEDDENITQ